MRTAVLLLTLFVIVFSGGCMIRSPYGSCGSYPGGGGQCYSDNMYPFITKDGRPCLAPEKQLQDEVFGRAAP